LPDQFEDAAALAGAHPEIPVVVNHTGMPRDQSPGWAGALASGDAAAAARPHVSVKISGFGMFDASWTSDSIRPLIRETIDVFGVDRCMFGSNFPVDKRWASYDRLMRAFDASTTDLSPAERRKLFHNNAERIYRL
jgi:predicted TIM-barrel fold metal-dependent hydrolase